MKRLGILLMVLPAAAQDRAAVDRLLDQKGVKASQVNIDFEILEKHISNKFLAFSYAPGRAKSKLKVIEDLHRDAWKLPGYADVLARGLRDSRGSVEAAHSAMGLGEIKVELPRPGTFLEELKKWGEPKGAEAVPADVAEAAALVLAAVRAARDKLPQERPDKKPFSTLRVEKLDEGFDYASMYVAGALIVTAVNRVRIKPHSEPFLFEMKTERGDIIIKGGSNDTWDRRDVLLLIDCGGDDDYTASTAGISTGGAPISVLIDVAGNDRYGPTGLGSFGVGVCADLEGADTYRGSKGLGAGYFGVGVLIDAAGDDAYASDTHAQGVGMFGIGMLVDRGGRDRYEILQFGQGCGLTKGVGVLLEEQGDDRYVARDPINGGKLEAPSAQTKEHNVSMAQGVGFGDRNALRAGGIGALVDVAGDDTYSAGVFGQGVGFYLAVGVLADFAGSDTYETFVYGQAQGVHGGMGILTDYRGNDRHRCQGWNCLALGVDWGVTWFIDHEGDDEYDVVQNGAAASLGNCVAIFYEASGNDTYHFKIEEGNILGKGVEYGGDDLNQDGKVEPREQRHWAFFFEMAGRDTYKSNKPPLADGKSVDWNATSAAYDRQ